VSELRTDIVVPESGGVDIVERALAILEEESRAWVAQQREAAEPSERGPNAR
jgi:hypothetical protein